MATGTVKWFNSQKGFGFIQPDTGGADVFVHISAVERIGMSTLVQGESVTYEVSQNDSVSEKALLLPEDSPIHSIDERAPVLDYFGFMNSRLIQNGMQLLTSARVADRNFMAVEIAGSNAVFELSYSDDPAEIGVQWRCELPGVNLTVFRELCQIVGTPVGYDSLFMDVFLPDRIATYDRLRGILSDARLFDDKFSELLVAYPSIRQFGVKVYNNKEGSKYSSNELFVFCSQQREESLYVFQGDLKLAVALCRRVGRQFSSNDDLRGGTATPYDIEIIAVGDRSR